MKKVFLIIAIAIFSLQPVFGVNWVQIDDKRYVDLDSVQKFNDSINYKIKGYTFWEKYLNDKSSIFIDAEKIYGKKIWYSLNNVVIDCENKKVALRSYIDYDLSKNVLGNHTYEDILLNWNIIAPESIGDVHYNLICKPNK